MAHHDVPSKSDMYSGPSPLPTAAGAPETALEEALRARHTQQSLLIEVNAALAVAIDVEIALPEILERLAARAQLLNARVYLLDQEQRQLRCTAETGFPVPKSFHTLELEGQGLVPWVARMGEALYVPDVSQDPRYLCADPRTKSDYAVPLQARANLLGVLNIESEHSDGIRAVTRKLVNQLASQVALAIERSNLYRQLRNSEERFRSIFEQGHIGVALGDMDGRFITVNQAYARILGYSPGEMRGLHFAETIHPDERQTALEGGQALLAGRLNTLEVEGRCVRKSGEPVWCSVTVSLIRDAGGHPACVMAMVQDISARKKAEEERARLQEQLAHAQKMIAIGTLAGGIAHDFNNLLGVILGYASLVRRRLPADDPLQEPVQIMEKSAQRAAELTSELLHIARQETCRLEQVHVAEVVDHVVRIAEETFDRRIAIESRRAPDLPGIAGDPGQLELALLNLFLNARDAMPEGGKLTIGTSAATLGGAEAPVPAQCAPGEYVCIAIKDTGVGIEPELLPHIFEPFFTTKEPGKGSGLGLATVYAIVSRHGGFVRAASELSRGSEFTIHLPVSARYVEPLREEAPLKAERGTGTVLVVDDEHFMLTFAEEALQELGYQALTAENGTQACEIYAQRAAEIDCVLLDMVMPGMSGLETQQALRAINPHVKVILASGYSGGAEADRARESRAAAFLGKPYTIETLAQVVKTVQVENGREKDQTA